MLARKFVEQVRHDCRECHEAKTSFPACSRGVESGEDVVIAAVASPWPDSSPASREKKRRPGRLKGKVVIPDDFFDPLPEEELKLWEGG